MKKNITLRKKYLSFLVLTFLTLGCAQSDGTSLNNSAPKDELASNIPTGVDFLSTYREGLCQLINSQHSYQTKLRDDTLISNYKDSEALRVLALSAKDDFEINNHAEIMASIGKHSDAQYYPESIRLLNLADTSLNKFYVLTSRIAGREGLGEAMVPLETFVKTINRIDFTVNSETESWAEQDQRVNLELLNRSATSPYQACQFAISIMQVPQGELNKLSSESLPSSSESEEYILPENRDSVSDEKGCYSFVEYNGLDGISPEIAGTYGVKEVTAIYKFPAKDKCPLRILRNGEKLVLESPTTLAAISNETGTIWYQLRVDGLLGWIDARDIQKQ